MRVFSQAITRFKVINNISICYIITNNLYIIKWFQEFKHIIAQYFGAVEYTDFITTEG